MELRHFRYVIAVAEELHFGRAAARLNISQPPLSQQIRLLEEELGVKLFERTKRNVQLTEAGARFVEEARSIVAQVDRAAKMTSRSRPGELRHLNIGMLWERRILVNSLRLFRQRYPDAHVELHSMGESQQIQALIEGRLHVGFTAGLTPKRPDLVYDTLAWEPLLVALPEQHHLTSLARVPLRALASEPYIMFRRDRNPHLYDDIIAVCRNAGFSLNIMHEADSVSSVMTLVAAGFGIALLPKAAGEIERKGMVFRELQGRLPKMESVMVYKRGAPPNVLRSFLDIVKRSSPEQAIDPCLTPCRTSTT